MPRKRPMSEGPAATAPRRSKADVLALCVPLFAQSGFDGISMRDIASAIGVTPAALYHHFRDKEGLYLAAVALAFERNTRALLPVLGSEEPAWQRLQAFIVAFMRVLSVDRDFQRILQWVLLDENPQRVQLLADNVFRDLLIALTQLARQLGGGFDPHLLTVSIMGLVMMPSMTANASRYLPSYRKTHERANLQARHVIALLGQGLAAS